MRNKDDIERLLHMKRAMIKIFSYTEDVDFRSFEDNEMMQDAIFKNLEIIGEAAYKITDETKILYSHVEWKKIEGLRHKLVHDYYSVDLRIVWQTKEKSLSILKEEVDSILGDFSL